MNNSSDDTRYFRTSERNSVINDEMRMLHIRCGCVHVAEDRKDGDAEVKR